MSILGAREDSVWARIRYRIAGPLLRLARAWTRYEGHRRPEAFRILLFHGIPKETEAAFGRLLEYVLKRYRVLSPQEVERRIQAAGRPCEPGQPAFLLTFDDGLASNARLIRHVLSPNGVQAVFFVCPELIDLPPGLQREAILRFYDDSPFPTHGSPSEDAMITWQDVEEALASRQTIGSHGMTHLRLSGLDEEVQRKEIVGSAHLIAERVGVSARWFSYPYGDLRSLDERSCRLIADHYQFCCSGIRGVNSGAGDPLALLREQVDLAAPLSYQLCAAEGGLDFAYALETRRLQQMVRRARRELLGRPE